MANYLIFDANNWVRRLLERDKTGGGPRTIYHDVILKYVPKGNVIFVWDGPHGNSKRKAIFPGYKAHRTSPGEGMFETFKSIEHILTCAPILQFKLPGYEGDDVVAHLTKKFAKDGHTVEIYSTDFDFVALAAEYPNQVFCGAQPKEGVPPKLVPYYKVCVGDQSDKIPGIPQFGPKVWDNVNKKDLVSFIDAIVNETEVPELELPARVQINHDDIRMYWKVVSFLDIDEPNLLDHMTIGKLDIPKANAYFKEFML